MSTFEQLLKVLKANHQRDRQPNRTPKTVPSPYPIPKLEHVLLRDPKRSDSSSVRTERYEMFRNMRLVLGSVEEPVPCRLCVRDGLLGGECLARDDEQRRLGIRKTQSLSEMGPVDIGHKVCVQIPLRVVLERFGDHNRPKVRPANSDVHDGLDRLARVTLPLPASHSLRKRLDVAKYVCDLIDAFLVDRPLGALAERNMQHSPVLGSIDVFSSEHLITGMLNSSLFGEREESVQDFGRNEVLGKVKEEGRLSGIDLGVVSTTEVLESVRVEPEEVLEDELVLFGVVDTLELFPGLVL